MTLTKELLRAARVDYERIQVAVPTFYDFEDMRIDNVHRMAAAAGFVERLLPETCDACNLDQCEDCHGTGELWDEGLVAVATKEIDSYLTGSNLSRFAAERIARAVLCALTQEVVK